MRCAGSSLDVSSNCGEKQIQIIYKHLNLIILNLILNLKINFVPRNLFELVVSFHFCSETVSIITNDGRNIVVRTLKALKKHIITQNLPS